MTETTWKNDYWQMVIKIIKEEYPHIVTTYSSSDGWANIAYKQERYHITYKMRWNVISSLLFVMKP